MARQARAPAPRGSGGRLPGAKRLQALLPRLHAQFRGRRFGVSDVLAWLEKAAATPLGSSPAGDVAATSSRKRGATNVPRAEAPSASRAQAAALLRRVAKLSGAVWRARGVNHADEYSRVSARGQRVLWAEPGYSYRLREVPSSSGSGSSRFEIVRVASSRHVGCTMARRTLLVHPRAVAPMVADSSFAGGKAVAAMKGLQRSSEGVWPTGHSYWKDCSRPRSGLRLPALVVNPVAAPGTPQQPAFTFIYLHMFSLMGSRYGQFPHFFNFGEAMVRVVLPTAPLRPQSCFKHWKEWTPRARRYKLIKFHSWFDYLTDFCGSKENAIDLASLLETRRILHALIDREVKRIGDPRRVILGGASQGCCVALDAALTYPEVLGGVVGLVGHLLGSTPLDPAKRELPLHLFHETTDKEMSWKWVGPIVRRLKAEGFNVHSRRERDPSGSGHNIGSIEGTWIRSALGKLVAGA
eukprot:TRINITY_DN5131_c0_g1_i1.p1 TRINITY_DN5131_c0_g1~~TRINITY_DN5131_c0_g1_i1.p1  ORF type:complete len:467 (-),score=84.08 TRINITY_DN5131_c0_g1_i1:159-1559(-)